jgi:hypothetical protein
VSSEFPTLAASLRHEGVQYHRTLPATPDTTSAIGKPWTQALNLPPASATNATAAEAHLQPASLKARAEAALVANFSSEYAAWAWTEGGSDSLDLRLTTKARPALVQDMRTGRELFFNQVTRGETRRKYSELSVKSA